jgi:hypothetical protein
MFVRISEVMKRSAKVVTTALVVTSLAGVGLAAPKNKKTEPAPTAAKIPDRIGVDISKLFWPQPPAIARLKYLDKGQEAGAGSECEAEINVERQTGGDRSAQVSAYRLQNALPVDAPDGHHL